MPRAKIVISTDDPKTTIAKLVEKEVIKQITFKGTPVYGRWYLTSKQIRKACNRLQKEQ